MEIHGLLVRDVSDREGQAKLALEQFHPSRGAEEDAWRVLHEVRVIENVSGDVLQIERHP